MITAEPAGQDADVFLATGRPDQQLAMNPFALPAMELY
jgi:hypothetical protein